MIIDLSAKILDLLSDDLSPVSDVEKNDPTPVTLKTLSLRALLFADKDLSAEDSLNCYATALKIRESDGDFDICQDDLEFLRKRMKHTLKTMPMYLGQVLKFLEGKPQ